MANMRRQEVQRSFHLQYQLSNAHNHTPAVACHRECYLFITIVTSYYKHTHNVRYVKGTNQSFTFCDDVKFAFEFESFRIFIGSLQFN
jgi:hypothetical protein